MTNSVFLTFGLFGPEVDLFGLVKDLSRLLGHVTCQAHVNFVFLNQSGRISDMMLIFKPLSILPHKLSLIIDRNVMKSSVILKVSLFEPELDIKCCDFKWICPDSNILY